MDRKMEESTKEAIAGTMATDKTNFLKNVSGKQYNQQKCHEVTLTDTNEIHLHATKESALHESLTRIRNL